MQQCPGKTPLDIDQYTISEIACILEVGVEKSMGSDVDAVINREMKNMPATPLERLQIARVGR